MECTDTANLIDPYIDGELDPGPAVEVAAHLRHCVDCTRTVEAHRALSRAIRSNAPRYAAPQHLRSSITAAIATEISAEARSPSQAVAAVSDDASAVVPLHRAAPGTTPGYWRPLALAASLVLA